MTARPLARFATRMWPLVLAGCGGDSVSAPPPPPPPAPPVVTTVELSPSSASLPVQDTVRLAATVKDQRGNVMTGKSATWDTDQAGIATVTSDGLVTAVGTGQASIRATVEGKTGSATITVIAAVGKVTIDRDTTALDIGASVQLAATLADAQGNPLTGRPIGWTSDAPAIATVSTTGLVTGVRHGLARIIATSGTRSDTATVLVNLGAATLTLEAGQAVTATVGIQGDTLRATGTDGTKYRLAIPPRALRQPVAITMTPIGSATGVPLSGGLAGGVDLKPSGLVFVSAATLVIETTKQPPAGQRLVGLNYRGAGTDLSLAPATAVAGGFAIPVGHFSGAAAGFGTAQDVDAIYFGTRSRSFTEDFYAAALVAAASSQPPNPAAELAILEQWWDTIVQRAMTDADTDAELANALGANNYWNSTAEQLGSFNRIPGGLQAPSLQARQTRFTADFDVKVKAAMLGNFALCAAPGLTADRVRALDNALFWYVLAVFGRTNPGIQAWFDQHVCARIVGDVVTLAEPLENGVNTLEMNFRLVLGPDQLSVPANFRIDSISVSGATHALPRATALTPAGYYTGPITPSGAGNAVTIFLTSCYLNGTNTALALNTTYLCGDHFISRTAKGAFSVEYLAQASLAAMTCDQLVKQTTGHFADLLAQQSCNDSGWPRSGKGTVLSGLSSGTVTGEVTSQPGGTASTHRLHAGGSVMFTDRLVIDAPGRAGTIGGFRASLELTESGSATTDNCRALVFATSGTSFLVTAAGGSELFSGNAIHGTCGGPTLGTIPSTVTSGDIGFIYGQSFDLTFDVQANAAMETGRFGVTASARASLRYRWLGMLGLPPGAVVRSATGIDWSKPAP